MIIRNTDWINLIIFILTVIGFVLLVGIISIGLAQGAIGDITERPIEKWTCFEYATDYKEKNPDWNCVIVCKHRFFYGSSHMMNYQINGSELTLYDARWNHTYTVNNFQWDTTEYYHFWGDNETVTRNYHRNMRDNRHLFYPEELWEEVKLPTLYA